MLILWNEEALREADAATAFYQQKQPSLGKRFLDNLEDAVSRIAHRPYLYHPIEANIRKCKLPHFPYAVIYRVQVENIQIVAVMHVRQEPGYWKYRT